MDQTIGHAVPPLLSGIKYVVRTELMYSNSINQDDINIKNIIYKD